MKTAIRLFAFFPLVLFSVQSLSQISLGAKRGDYIFGLNAGFAYQSSDVRSGGNGSGFGLTLGRTVLAGAYSPVSVDVRGRLLYARTFGLDPFRSFQIENNRALNGTRDLNYLTYPPNLDEPRGFVFQNHRTTHGELGLEAVFTLEELRRKTGFITSVFGGIGLNGFHVKTDQADASGNEYYVPYSTLNDNRPVSAILRDLRGSVLDGAYETNADGFDGFPQFRLMPSVGVELGFHLTPALSLHAGHRITFSGTDLLDGHQWASQDKDMYHYTSFGLNYRFRPPARPAVLPPVIELTSPLTRPFYTRDPGGRVTALVRHVRNAGEVTCTVNGRNTSFRLSGEQLFLDFPLQPGSNNVVITARNRAGSARADAVIVLEQVILPPPPPPVGYPPRVTITNPSSRSATVTEASFALRATAGEVSSRNDIEVTLDGARQNFNFDTRSGNITAQLNLREGVNRVRVTARNNFGADAADADLVYEPRRFAPTVRILEPANRSEVQVNSVNLRAEVRYMELKENIYLYINGRETRNFEYDASRETVRATVSLAEGANTVEVLARNRSGEARDAVTVTFRRPVQTLPPSVSITTPAAANTTTTAATALIEALTRNIQRREDVTFFVNGARNDNFSFNASNGRFNATVNLIPGNNDIAIRVANIDGSDQAAVSIRRTEQGGELPQPPRVRITSPANQSTTDRNTADVRASVENVADRNSVSLLINGARTTNFSFDPRNRELSASATLIEGNNTIRVEVTNRDGTSSDEVNVRYRKGTPPLVSIAAPDHNSTTTNPATTLRARVQHITDRNQISLTLNGNAAGNFSFNASNGELNANLTLVEGNNTLRVRAATPDGSDEKSVNVTYRKPSPPVVSIAAPDHNSTITNPATTLRARVQHVTDRNQISVTLNGNAAGNFSFNASNGELSANLTLVEGNNTLRVRAATPDGSDEKSVNVTYRKLSPPVVSIAAPKDNAMIEDNFVQVQATIANLSNTRGLNFTVNGKSWPSYTFDKGNFSARVENLLEGENTLTISAQNQDGNAQGTVKVVYRPKDLGPKPIVRFIVPARPGMQARREETQIRASVLYVSSADDIRLLRNGKLLGDFSYDPKAQELTATVPLEGGANLIKIIAGNAVGSDTASTVISRPQEELTKVNLPVVTIESVSQPTLNPMDPSQGSSTVIANIKGIDAASQIAFKVNGVEVRDFTFNSKTGAFQSTFRLVRGANTIVIRAENTDGTDEKSRTLEF